MRREFFEQLKKHLPRKEYTVLTGARQTGKSTLLRQLETYCKTENIPCVFLNLEQKAILADLDANPLNVLKYLPDSEQRRIVFVDEVQYLADPSNFLKLLYDEYAATIKLVVTGSSAFYIDDQFRDSLAGRKQLFQLLTCTFDEYLQLGNKDDLLAEKKRIETKSGAKTTQLPQLKNEWENYMLFGGYPAVILEPDRAGKIRMLQEIRDSFVKRDILESGVVNETAFYNLFRIMAAQSGQMVNVNELANTVRIKNETVNNYLWVMQKCFHIALVKPFFKNLRKELTKMPKVFLMDTGLRNCLLNNFQPLNTRADKGELWENMFYRLLAEKYNWDAIQYWRTADGNEVDFILAEIEHPQAIEIKFDEALIKTSKYKKFVESYPELPLAYSWVEPFDEHFFRRIKMQQ